MKRLSAVHIALPTLIATTTFGNCCLTQSTTIASPGGFAGNVWSAGGVWYTEAKYYGTARTFLFAYNGDMECGTSVYNQYDQLSSPVTTTSMQRVNLSTQCDFLKYIESEIGTDTDAGAFAAWAQ